MLPIFPGHALLDISRTEGTQQVRTANSWHWFTDDGYGVALPLNISILYRGQNQRVHPMLPSIARGLSSQTGKIYEMTMVDQATVVLRLAQSAWFARELSHHPIAAHAENQHVRLDRIALAQHYGIPTGYLDLTDNFDVAAFFATCRETATGWEPVTQGVGVLYRVDLTRVEHRFGMFQPLGPQPLPRPDEQSAWTAEIPMVHSFDGWPIVSIIEFEHDKKIGEYFLQFFDGGKILFPPDPLANVAHEIIQSGEMPKELVEGVLVGFAKDEFGPRSTDFASIRQSLAKLAHLSDYRQILDEQHVAPYLADFEWRKKRLSDVLARTRPIRIVPVSELKTGTTS